MTGCCLLILMFSQGVAYSVAPLIVEWLEIFDKGQEKTGWISSVNIAVMFLTGQIIKHRLIKSYYLVILLIILEEQAPNCRLYYICISLLSFI